MFSVLDGSSGNVLGVEITGGYTKEDVEAFKSAFEKVLAGGADRVNLLVKMDQMRLTESELGAFVQDARYALHFLKRMRHVAIVGHGKTQAFLVKVDNMLLGKPEDELIERFFEAADMDKAWEFVRG